MSSLPVYFADLPEEAVLSSRPEAIARSPLADSLEASASDPDAARFTGTALGSDSESGAKSSAESGAESGLAIDRASVFSLITQVLPLEICLYHRILPLRRAETVLTLGMVDPSDREALTYAERIASYQGLRLTPVFLPGATHQQLLSAYLHYIGQPAAAVEPEPVGRDADPSKTGLERDLEEDLEENLEENPEETVFTPAEQTLFTPPQNPGENAAVDQPIPAQQLDPLAELAAEAGPPTLSQPVEHRSTFYLDVTDVPPLEPLPSPEQELELETFSPAEPAEPEQVVLPPLYVEHQHLVEPLEAIALLPTPQFLAELLGRILANGITRVLFGSAGGPGRIAWDWQGSAQLALGQIDPPRFRALMAELKVLAGLPAEPVRQPTRRMVMRSFEGQPVMLKLSVEPIGLNEMRSPLGPGEKIQMQVLRGARLIAHEQHRLAQLEQETLATAELLQRKLQQMQAMRQTLPVLEVDRKLLAAVSGVARQNAAAVSGVMG